MGNIVLDRLRFCRSWPELGLAWPDLGRICASSTALGHDFGQVLAGFDDICATWAGIRTVSTKYCPGSATVGRLRSNSGRVLPASANFVHVRPNAVRLRPKLARFRPQMEVVASELGHVGRLRPQLCESGRFRPHFRLSRIPTFRRCWSTCGRILARIPRTSVDFGWSCTKLGQVSTRTLR